MQKPALPFLGQKSRMKSKLKSIQQSQICYQALHSQNFLKSHSNRMNINIEQVDFSQYNCTPIFIEIIKLTLQYGTTKHSPKYSQQWKLFSYSIYCLSQAAYRSLRKQFRLPSERCLRKTFEQKIKKIKKNFTEIDLIKNSIPINNFLFQITIPCTLIIDAFSISTITPFNKV